MIPKLITNTAYDFEGPSASLVPLHSRGVDQNWIVKTAGHGVFHNFLRDFMAPKGKTVIHVLAVGDEELYGPNRNGDGFSREDNRTAHRSFVDLGHVFRNHQNDDPFKAVGEVLRSAHNRQMSRIELLLGLDNDKCRREIEAFSNGDDVPVSMGCFTAGHRLTLDDGSTIRLEDAEEGQHVLTHMGNRLPITHVFAQDPYNGTLYKVSARTVEDVEATAEHPFYVVRQEHLIHTGHKTRRIDPDKLDRLRVTEAAEWVAAKDLAEGDYLVTPINTEEELPDYMSEALARLLGYYAAKGHVRLTPDARRYCSVQFSLNKADEAVTEVPRLCEELGIPREKIRSFESSHSEHFVAISVADSELAYRCATLCGMHAKKKRLSPEMMLLPYGLQKQFLGALINGDSGAGSNEQEGALYISTASPFYRDQLRALLARVGVVPGVNTVKHRAGTGKNTYNTTEYQIYVPRTDTHVLAPYTVKAVREETVAHHGGSRLRVGDFILTPIDLIATREVEEEPIYNIEVMSDNSYLVNGIAVHNSMQDYDVCSLCGHKAPTAADHCTHVKSLLGQIMEDGRRVYMKNPNPRYFDISIVFKPADRIAYALRKVASAAGHVVGGHELAQMVGLGSWANPKFATMRALASLYKRTPMILRGKTAPQPLQQSSVNELRKKAQIHGLDQLLSFLNANGWLLSPQDFGSVIGHQDPDGCAGAVVENDVTDDLFSDHTEVKTLAPPVAQERIPLSASCEEDLQANTVMTDPHASGRVLRVTIVKAAAMQPSCTLDASEARGFAELYGHYKVAFAHAHSSRSDVLRAVASSF